MLAVVHDGVAYPLLFTMLPKMETSNSQERIDLVQRYISLFGLDTIDCLLADREFVGEAEYLHHIFYLKGQACYLSGSRLKGHDGNPERQIIASFNKPENAVSAYRQRWQFETMFKAMKSAGFNIEDTHLSDIERIEKLLLLVMMMAFVWCYNIGEFVNQNLKPIRILKHGRKAKSIFRYGLDIVTEYLTKGRNDYDIPIFKLLSPDNLSFTPI